MSHLTCLKHKSRVLVLPERTVHRSDGSACNSTLSINNREFTAEQIRNLVHQRIDND